MSSLKKAPLYAQLRESIRSDIERERWEVGERIPSIRKLSELYQMSDITVRKAVKDLMNDGMLYSQHGSGLYVKSPGMVKKSIVQFWLPTASMMHDNYSTLLIHHLSQQLAKHQITLEIHDLNQKLDELPDLNLDHDLRGIIIRLHPDIFSSISKKSQRLAKLTGIPVVYLDYTFPNQKAVTVEFNNSTATRDITKNMIDTGHRRLAYLSNLQSISPIAEKRKSGFERAVKSQNENQVDVHYYHLNVNGETEAIDEILNQLKNNKTEFLFIAYPPLLMPFINRMQKHPSGAFDNLKIAAFTEENYREYISAPICAIIKPTKNLIRSAINCIVKKSNRSKVISHETVVPSEWELPDSTNNQSAIPTPSPQLVPMDS